MKYLVFGVILLAVGPGHAQREWVLQPFMEVKGYHSRVELGRFVYGFPDPNTNIPFNVVAGKLWDLGMYSIHSKSDTLPIARYFGVNLVQGDFNGDGFMDIAVAHAFEYNFDVVNIFLGSSSGINGVPSVVIPGEKISDEISSDFGEHMCCGDLNNDGYDDLVISDHSYITKNNWGKVYIYMGKKELSTKCDYSTLGYRKAGLGIACAAGDLNHDGYDDLCLFGFDTNAPNDSGDQFSYVEIYMGSANFETNRDFYLRGTDYTEWGKLLIMDANGDGIQDLLWSTNNPDKRRHGPQPNQAVLIFNGGKDFDLKYDFIIPHPDTGWSQVSNFGDVLANAGDMNGDGYDDILIGAPYSFYSCGMMFVYCGGPALDTFFDAAKGQLEEGFFGRSLAGVGDVNGDGLSDIIVGAPTYDWDYMFGYFVILLGDRRIPSDVLPEYQFPEPPPPPPPEAYALRQNYPNPFNGRTEIEYDLPAKAFVRISITDILGRQVRTLVSEEQGAGSHICDWDGRNQEGKEVSGGAYFYKMEAGDYVQVRSMTLVR